MEYVIAFIAGAVLSTVLCNMLYAQHWNTYSTAIKQRIDRLLTVTTASSERTEFYMRNWLRVVSQLPKEAQYEELDMYYRTAPPELRAIVDEQLRVFMYTEHTDKPN